MKCVLVFLLIVGIALAMPTADINNSRGCIYIEGHCSEGCPVGTHEYTTGCGPLTPEVTCKDPKPKTNPDEDVCDFSACYCDPPTVRDEKTKNCVTLDKCSK